PGTTRAISPDRSRFLAVSLSLLDTRGHSLPSEPMKKGRRSDERTGFSPGCSRTTGDVAPGKSPGCSRTRSAAAERGDLLLDVGAVGRLGPPEQVLAVVVEGVAL